MACLVGQALGCPRFSEFFPDPVDVSDQQGEFVEIRLEDSGTLAGAFADTLLVQFEDKAPLRFAYAGLRGMKRLLLVHDSTGCGPFSFNENVVCGSLGKLSLPNSRESLWRLSAGNCLDSALLPSPKAGKSLQRVKETEDWTVADPTPGFANPYYELGIADCGISLSLSGNEILLDGCDSAALAVEVTDLFSGKVASDSVTLRKSFSLEPLFALDGFPDTSSFWLKARLPRDEAPANDSLDTLLLGTRAPLQVSEVHHCPAEPEPEWVEVYNGSSLSLPLGKFCFCSRGGSWGADSIAPRQSLVFTKDTLQLREFMGFRDVGLVQVSLGYLNNTAGSVAICMGEVMVDSVAWDKSTVACPGGFTPRTGTVEDTPGFQGRHHPSGGPNGAPFEYRLSSRVVRRNGNPLRVFVESEFPVELRFLDSAGREVYRRTLPAQSNSWWDIPRSALPSVGIAYVELSAGKYEKLVGILVRP